MSKASTNGELPDIDVVGGTVVTDPERGITEIPPEGSLKKASTTKEADMLEISLSGKGYINEIKTAEKETQVKASEDEGR